MGAPTVISDQTESPAVFFLRCVHLFSSSVLNTYICIFIIFYKHSLLDYMLINIPRARVCVPSSFSPLWTWHWLADVAAAAAGVSVLISGIKNRRRERERKGEKRLKSCCCIICPSKWPSLFLLRHIKVSYREIFLASLSFPLLMCQSSQAE